MAVWSDDDDIVCVHPGRPARDRRARRSAPRSRRSSSAARIPVQAGSVRRTRSLDGAVHNLIETVTIQSAEGAQQGVCRRHQRLHQDRAGLAHGRRTTPARAACSSRASPTKRPPRCTDGQPARCSGSTRTHPARAALAAGRQRCRRSGQRCAHAASRMRHGGASAGTRRMATSSTSTSSTPRRTRRCWCCSTAWRARRKATTRAHSRTGPRQHGWRFAVPHLRGCSGELNLAPRAYHSGDHEEVGWLLARLRAQAGVPLHVVGVSLGGNALLRWAEEAGDAAATRVRALASVSAPLDLAAGGMAIGRGFNRLVYTRMFLRTMKPKALAKLAQHPGLFDRERLLSRAHAVRVRQRVHRAAARLSRHRRLLGARIGQAAPGAHPRPGAGAQRAQRSVRAGVPACRATGRRARHAVAAGARRPRRASPAAPSPAT